MSLRKTISKSLVKIKDRSVVASISNVTVDDILAFVGQKGMIMEVRILRPGGFSEIIGKIKVFHLYDMTSFVHTVQVLDSKLRKQRNMELMKSIGCRQHAIKVLAYNKNTDKCDVVLPKKLLEELSELGLMEVKEIYSMSVNRGITDGELMMMAGTIRIHKIDNAHESDNPVYLSSDSLQSKNPNLIGIVESDDLFSISGRLGRAFTVSRTEGFEYETSDGSDDDVM